MQSALFIFKQRKETGPGWLLDRCEGLNLPVKVDVFGSGNDLPLGIQCKGVVIVGLPLPAAAFATKDPDIREQQVFVRTLIGLAVPTLGIGYGAQLLATALLGQAQEPVDETLGAATMSLTPDGRLDPIFGGLAEQLPVVRWPGPHLTLSRRAKLLAGTAARPDAFRQGECAWGLCPHLEVTASGFGDWLADPAHSDLLRTRDSDALRAAVDEQQDAQRDAAYTLMNNFLVRVDAFLHDVPPVDIHQPPPGLPDV